MKIDLYPQNNTDHVKAEKFKLPINEKSRLSKLDRLCNHLLSSSKALSDFLNNPSSSYTYDGITIKNVDKDSYVYNSYKLKVNPTAVESAKSNNPAPFFKCAKAYNLVPSSYYNLINDSPRPDSLIGGLAVVNIVIVYDFVAIGAVAYVAGASSAATKFKTLSIDPDYSRILKVADDMGGHEFAVSVDDYIISLYKALIKKKISASLLPWKRHSALGFE